AGPEHRDVSPGVAVVIGRHRHVPVAAPLGGGRRRAARVSDIPGRVVGPERGDIRPAVTVEGETPAPATKYTLPPRSPVPRPTGVVLNDQISDVADKDGEASVPMVRETTRQ